MDAPLATQITPHTPYGRKRDVSTFVLYEKDAPMGVLDLRHGAVSHDHTIYLSNDDLEPSRDLPARQPCRCH